MKTSELTGAALDWAVAKCEGHLPEGYSFDPHIHCYSTSWTKGGPIIEREINRVQEITEGLWEAEAWSHTEEGPTPLIAAMRCYVASKFGNTVEIPNELAKG
jgi:hypothetical protein